MEQNLVEDLTIEAIKMYGMDMVYLPREITEEDSLFGEGIQTKFSNHRLIEMYIESVDGFGGAETDIMSKFGLQINDQASLIVSRRRFTEVMCIDRPKEGDLIYFPLSNSLFEINHVEHENPFYQLGKNYSFKITIELFTYSHEEFNTGLDVDDISHDRSQEMEIDRADNHEIQDEIEEIAVKNDKTNDYPTIDDDNLFDQSNPFGDM